MGLIVSLFGFIKSFTLTTTKALAKKVDFKALKRGKLGSKKLNKREKLQLSLEYTKAIFIVCIGVIIALFELFPIFMLIMLLLLIVIIIIIFIVVVMQLQNILDLNIENFTLPQEEMGMSNSCVNPSGTKFALQFTEEELARSGGALSNYEKNIYRIGIVARETIDGFGGTELAQSEYTSRDGKIIFVIGTVSIESSMQFFTDDKTDTSSIFTKETMHDANGSLYGFAGIHRDKTLLGYYGATVTSTIKQKYPYSGSLSYQAKFAPYGVAMSGKHFANNIQEVLGHTKWLEAMVKVENDFGIVANKKEFESFVVSALGQVKYHTGNKFGTVASHGYADEIEAYVYFWGALFAMTSDNDAERSWSKWSLDIGNPTDYGESSFRRVFMSSSGMDDNRRASTPLDFRYPTDVMNKIKLNGVTLKETVWTTVWKKYSSNAGVQKSWKAMQAFARVKTDRPLNFHYGFNSMLQGERVITTLQEKMGVITTTGNVSTIKCTDEGEDISYTNGEFKGQKGKTMSKIDGVDLTTYLKEGMGKIAYLRNKAWIDKMLASAGYTTSTDKDSGDKAYGQVFKYHMGVPYYNQDTSAGYNSYRYAPSGPTLQLMGCAIYSMAFCATLSTGTIINPAEMAVLANITGQQDNVGVSSDQYMVRTFAKIGVEAGFMGNSSTAQQNLDRVIKELEKGDRVVIFRTRSKLWSTGKNHYMVFTGIVTQNGQKFMTVYSSVPGHGNNTLYTMEQVKARIGFINGVQPNQGNATWVKYK